MEKSKNKRPHRGRHPVKGKSQGGKSKKGFPKKNKVTKTQKEEQEIILLQEKYKKLENEGPKSASFASFPLSSATVRGLRDSGYTETTEVQRETLRYSLRGLDVLGAAKTGSGKTLAFVIPLLERLFVKRWSREDGLGALVITPTRELAYQIFDVLNNVGRFHEFSAGLVIGGKDLAFERDRMATCNIVVCTPGRLLQHMDENPQFDASQLQLLVLDEADRCLEMGFAAQMNAILANLPSEARQTLLFSATQTRSVKDLARCGLSKPVLISVHEHASKATPDELVEHYMVCPLDQKIDILWSFIKNHRKKKVLVFLQSCKQVRYYSDLFRRLRAPTVIWSLYGTLHQLRRMAIYKEFCEAKKGVLMATDLAGRGLDFPTVDWVVQLDCPEDWKAYNHRVGRTARNKSQGNALLILTPSEEDAMLRHLRIHRFSLERIEANPNKIMSVQKKIQAHLASDRDLKDQAQRAFLAYLKSIFLMKDKSVFDVFQLDTDSFAASLGLAVPPRVRFLQKHLKNKQAKLEKLTSDNGTEGEETVAEVKKSNKQPILGVLSQDESEDEEDIFKVKRLNHELSEAEEDEDDDSLNISAEKSSKKIVTKTAAAKKLLKKSFQVNHKVTFDEEGEIKDDSQLLKKSAKGKTYERLEDKNGPSGIDINVAKDILQAEDAYDLQKERQRVRQLHKEKKRKEKEDKNKRKKESEEDNGDELPQLDQGSDYDSSEDGNLDWLPDPDKIYGKKDSDADSESEMEEDDRGDRFGRKRKTSVTAKGKRRKVDKKQEDEESDEYDMDDRKELGDDELLALQLLKSQ